MTLPKYRNPHHAGVQEQPVSRADYFRVLSQDAGDETQPLSHAYKSKELVEEHTRRLRWLHDQLNTSMIFDSSAQSSEIVDGIVVDVKKRRKKRKRDRDAESLYDFCLLSSASSRRVNIKPKLLTVKTRHREYEDSEKEALIRSQHARESAVDISWLTSRAQDTFPPSKPTRALATSASYTLPSPACPPNIFVTSLPMHPTLKHHVAQRNPQASPHQTSLKLRCPLITVKLESGDVRQKTKRRLRSRKPRRVKTFR